MKTITYFFAQILFISFGLQAQTIMNIHQNNGTVLQLPLNTIDSITYTIPNPGNLATLNTTAPSLISETTAVSGGNVTSVGGSIVTQRGICYSINPSPTTANSTIISGSGMGIFTCNLTGLISNTTYYVRAYATNNSGTAYGNEVSFTTTTNGGIVTNPGAGVTFDGYSYLSIVLGNGQEWMSENLRTNVYANGDPIPNVTNITQWSNLTTGAFVFYNNDVQNENVFGKLYNWYTVNDTRNVCPTGWHVPSYSEWTVLADYLGGIANAGGKMKSPGIQYWASPNLNATNESGFTGLPGGYRDYIGQFSDPYFYGYWWNTSEYSITNAWMWGLFSNTGILNMYNIQKTTGLSVRCLKD